MLPFFGAYHGDKQVELIEQLKSLKFLVEDTDEFNKFVQRYWEFRNSQEYIKVVIVPTTRCNFSCPYCFETGANKSDMSDAICNSIIAKINAKLSLKKTKGVVLIWYGGEPLLKWDIIKRITTDILDYCRNNNIAFAMSLVTNGYLLTPDMVAELKQLGCTSIQITLDGSKPFHNKRRCLGNGVETFDVIFRNICLCCHEIATTVRINIDKNNISGIKDLIDEFVDHGLIDVVLFFAPIESFNNANKSCYTIEQFASVQAHLIKYAVQQGLIKCVNLPLPNFGFCEAVNVHNYLFDSDGDNFFCWENVGRKDLTNSSINNRHEFYKLYNYFVNTYSFHKDECTTCPVFPLCLGGCPQRKLEMGKAPCSMLYYNIKDLLSIYYKAYLSSCVKV